MAFVLILSPDSTRAGSVQKSADRVKRAKPSSYEHPVPNTSRESPAAQTQPTTSAGYGGVRSNQNQSVET